MVPLVVGETLVELPGVDEDDLVLEEELSVDLDESDEDGTMEEVLEVTLEVDDEVGMTEEVLEVNLEVDDVETVVEETEVLSFVDVVEELIPSADEDVVVVLTGQACADPAKAATMIGIEKCILS